MGAILERNPFTDYPPASHPETGEAFVEHDEVREDTDQRWVIPEPNRPTSRTLYVDAGGQRYYEDPGDAVRTETLTETEWAQANERYVRAMAEWRRTGGVAVSRGPRRYTSTFRCASGDSAVCVGDGERWFWVEVKTRAAKCEDPLIRVRPLAGRETQGG